MRLRLFLRAVHTVMSKQNTRFSAKQTPAPPKTCGASNGGGAAPSVTQCVTEGATCGVNVTQKSPHSTLALDVSDMKFEVLPSPTKSRRDKKEYKVIRLENGLTACLISDMQEPYVGSGGGSDEASDGSVGSSSESSISDGPDDDPMRGVDEEVSDSEVKQVAEEKQKMAAAALTISVGSFSDPEEVPGLAHFLEHMVFMGSEKFPNENDFDKFITQKGGSNNASTDCETTTFHFECLEKYLYKSLDKFAQFFISPLMKKSSMTREREAIDSEFQMALPNDAYRKEQMLYTLFNPDVPVNQFTWGNLETLKTEVADNVLYETLHEFRKRHYSGHRMTLCIQARLPMETLQNYVLDCFRDVHVNSYPPIDFSTYASQIYDTPNFNKFYYVIPIRNVVQVDLTWALPSLLHLYKGKPHQYVSWLLGDEGKGSLMSYLRKKVWALSIYTGNGETGSEHNSMYAHFSTTVILTQSGLEHIHDVIKAIFSYINLLKQTGPVERIYNEIKSIADTAFIYADEKVSAEMVENMAESMQYYPSEDYLTGSELYFEYKPDDIRMVLNYLRPDNVNIMILNKDMPKEIVCDLIEPWFKTKYAIKDIPNKWLEDWANVEPYPDFALPGPNQYLTDDFSLLPKVADHPDAPIKLVDTEMMEMWHRTDQKFDTPTACYNFNLISPMVIESPTNACLLDMYITLLTLQMTEEGYPAQVAELDYSFSTGDKGLVIGLSGYNQKLPILLELVGKYVKTMHLNLSEDMFNAVKEKQVMTYYNRFNKPSILNKDLRLSLILNTYWTPIDRYGAILRVNYQMMKTFAVEVIRNGYLQALIQGNVTPEVAIAATEIFVHALGYEQLLPNTFPKIRVVQLPTDEHCCRVMTFNHNDANSIITNYYQAGPFTIKNSATIEMLMMLIDEPLFNILRTKEQLGYNVFCTSRHTFGILGYSISVNTQAAKHTTAHVDERIEAFIKHIQKMLKKMTDKKLNQSKRDLIKVKHIDDTLLREEVGRNWGEITSREYMFDRLKQEIRAIEELKLSDLRKFWDDHNMCGNKSAFRKLTIQVVGYCDTSSDPVPESENKCLPEEKRELMNRLNEYVIQLMASQKEWNEPARTNTYYVGDIETFKHHQFLYPSWTSLKLILPFKQPSLML